MNDDENELEDELEDDDDFDYDYEMSEVEEWYDDNFGYFKRNSKRIENVDEEISPFYYSIYTPIITELAPQIRKLMLKQFPIIGEENRPLILDNINWTIKSTCHEFAMQIYMIIQDQKEGVNFREQYPEFDSWVSFYGRPAEKPVPDYTFFDKIPEISKHLTEQQKKEIIDESYENQLEVFILEERLMKEYYDIVQPVVFKYYKELEDLEYEAWIMYAVQIRESYEDYKYRCEHLETFIEYGFDEQDINLDYTEFKEKLTIKYKEMDEKRKISTSNLDENE